MRTFVARSFVPPTRRIAWLSSARSKRGCKSSGSSPISSRNNVPPRARSKAPSCSACAPVKAPRSWPNSSLSTRFAGTEPQSNTTKGADARALASWTACAVTSLPVPVSPSSVSVTSVRASRRKIANTSPMATEAAEIFPKLWAWGSSGSAATGLARRARSCGSEPLKVAGSVARKIEALSMSTAISAAAGVPCDDSASNSPHRIDLARPSIHVAALSQHRVIHAR